MLGIERATGYSAAWMATGRGPKLAKLGRSDDPKAEQLRKVYDAILALPEEYQEKIAQDVEFLRHLGKGDTQAP